jgi:hypothetical protein
MMEQMQSGIGNIDKFISYEVRKMLIGISALIVK